MDEKELDQLKTDGLGTIVQPLEQTMPVSRERFGEIVQTAFRIGLLTILLFGAFFFPFMIGMKITHMRDDTSRMQVEMVTLEKKIQEYNQRIAIYGDRLQISQNKSEKGNQ